MADGILWKFAVLEVRLAEMHGIALSKRTAFRARLKNLHRLNFPIGFQMSKGRAALFEPGDIVQMALAMELTQLGLTPERVVRVLTMNWYPATMAIAMAASALAGTPFGFDAERVLDSDPLSMFLFFDPSALSSLTEEDDVEGEVRDRRLDDDATDSFFYGGQGVVRDNIVKWTSGYTHRISMVNVTAMLDMLAGYPFPSDEQRSLAWRAKFFGQISQWAYDFIDRYHREEPKIMEQYLATYVRNCVRQPVKLSDVDAVVDEVSRDIGWSEDGRAISKDVVRTAVLNLLNNEESKNVS